MIEAEGTECGGEASWYEVVVRREPAHGPGTLATMFTRRNELPRLLERLRALRLELVACEPVR